MSDLTQAIEDLLGPTVKAEFYVPIDDPKQNFDYKTTFGTQTDLTVETGLKVKAPATQSINLRAAFKGQLFFSPAPHSFLRLRIAPLETLLLRTALFEAESSPSDVIFMPVEDNSVKKAVESLLKARGLSKTRIQSMISGFMGGNGVGIHVNCGQNIGAVHGSALTILFMDIEGRKLHPLYQLWKYRKQIGFSNSKHPIISKLQLDSVKLDLKNGRVLRIVSQGKEDIGTYLIP